MSFKLIDKKLLLTPVSGIGGKRYGQFQTKLEKGGRDFPSLSVSSIISDMFGQNVESGKFVRVYLYELKEL